MAASRPKIATYVFCDTETTGLPTRNNIPSITELCFIAVGRKTMRNKDEDPRVVHKLLICLNPKQPVQAKAKEISGLSNELLNGESPFSLETATMMSHFLQRLKSPVCLVAHNGDQFDYRLLNSELVRAGASLPEDIRCADSLIYFRSVMDPQQSCKLGDIYQRVFDEPPPAAHSAEGDCVNLMKILKEHSPHFLKWVDRHAVPLHTITPFD